jgi:hypothetical protein
MVVNFCWMAVATKPNPFILKDSLSHHYRMKRAVQLSDIPVVTRK